MPSVPDATAGSVVVGESTRGPEVHVETIYLDHAATTPMRAEVKEAMLEAWDAYPGNPSSSHGWGRGARAALEEARERLAAALGAERGEVVFTPSGTMADNLAILGRVRAAQRRGGAGPVVCSAVEHSAVLRAVEAAGREGAPVVVLSVDSDGRVGIETVTEALTAAPAVVSVMWGNNEVGTLQPIREIAERCRAAGVVVHTDAVQAFGHDRVRVDEVPVDLLTLSAHKLGGPKGIGALYVRRGVELDPILFGGGQERGLSPATENVAAAIGFAVAAEIVVREREAESERLRKLRDRLEAGLRERIPRLEANGAGAPRLPHIASLTVPDVDQGVLLAALDLEGLAVATGSACRSGAAEPSHVLVAMGRDVPGGATLRLSLGWTTTEKEIEGAIARIEAVVSRARSMATI